MKISLNEIVSLLSSRVGQAWNTDLQEEMKVAVNTRRAEFFKRLLEQHPEQRRYFLRDFSAELITVDKATCPVTVDCDVLRTKYKVPLPVRSSQFFFDFVGSSDKSVAFAYAAPEYINLFAKYNKYTSRTPKYFYVNGYVYLYTKEDIEWINIRGVFDDPRQLSAFKCADQPCYTDDDQYEMPDDLITSIIKDILNTELRQQPPQEGVVQLDKSDKKTEQGGPTVNY